MPDEQKCARLECTRVLGKWVYVNKTDPRPKPEYCSSVCCALAQKVVKFKPRGGEH